MRIGAARALPVVAFFLLACGTNALRQPSAAMEPTVLVGDQFLIADPPTPEPGLVVALAVARGTDHEVFPASTRSDLEREFDVKRIVAVSGDTVAMQDGQLVINGSPVVRVDTGRSYRDANGRSSLVFTEQLGDREYEVLATLEEPTASRDHPPTEVPPGHVFVLGDNRDFSRDSRAFGPFPVSDIAGLVGEIYRSVDPQDQSERRDRAGIEVN